MIVTAIVEFDIEEGETLGDIAATAVVYRDLSKEIPDDEATRYLTTGYREGDDPDVLTLYPLFRFGALSAEAMMMDDFERLD